MLLLSCQIRCLWCFLSSVSEFQLSFIFEGPHGNVKTHNGAVSNFDPLKRQVRALNQAFRLLCCHPLAPLAFLPLWPLRPSVFWALHPLGPLNPLDPLGPLTLWPFGPLWLLCCGPWSWPCPFWPFGLLAFRLPLFPLKLLLLFDFVLIFCPLVAMRRSETLPEVGARRPETGGRRPEADGRRAKAEGCWRQFCLPGSLAWSSCLGVSLWSRNAFQWCYVQRFTTSSLIAKHVLAPFSHEAPLQARAHFTQRALRKVTHLSVKAALCSNRLLEALGLRGLTHCQMRKDTRSRDTRHAT